MLDRAAVTLLRPAIDRLAGIAVAAGLGANQLTLLGFAIGMGAAVLIIGGHFLLGAAAILVWSVVRLSAWGKQSVPLSVNRQGG